MNNEEQMADTIEMLYQRLNGYNKQDLFNYGYLLESNQILCKDIEEKDKQLDKYKNVIDKIKEILLKHIDNANEELQIILKYNNDLKYKNQCSHDFDIIRQNVEIIYNNILELLEEVE